jgi:hypothetical protein
VFFHLRHFIPFPFLYCSVLPSSSLWLPTLLLISLSHLPSVSGSHSGGGCCYCCIFFLELLIVVWFFCLLKTLLQWEHPITFYWFEALVVDFDWKI